jgi:hypothetical protein
MTKTCPRCKKPQDNEQFLSISGNRLVKSCKRCRKVAKDHNAKTKNIQPTRQKIDKKTMKELNDELQAIAFKISTIKKLETEYRDKLREIQREYTDELLRSHCLILSP